MAHTKTKVTEDVTVQLGITFQQISHWNVSHVVDMAIGMPFAETSGKEKEYNTTRNSLTETGTINSRWSLCY
jgi:hypothetical protein